MQFETQQLYHIYNQGNNHQKIFFKRENYLFFLEKIRVHVLPYADVLAWCLMPNHFHLMVYVKHVELPAIFSDGVTPSHPVTKNTSFNQSIGTMLRSYARAVNVQENRSGALFREETKAICLTKPDRNLPAYYQINGINYINIEIPEKQYPNVCYNYILKKPVKDGLVSSIEFWEFSSYQDI